jgi:hypothetical protein
VQYSFDRDGLMFAVGKSTFKTDYPTIFRMILNARQTHFAVQFGLLPVTFIVLPSA